MTVAKKKKEEVLDVRIVIKGENAVIVREGLDAKMEKENRTKYHEAVADIVINHFKAK